MLFCLLLLLLIALRVECAIPEHEVVGLPGWSGKLPTRQYSGYIPVDNPTTGKQLHYWLSCMTYLYRYRGVY